MRFVSIGLLAGLMGLCPFVAQAANHTILMHDQKFQPAALKIKKGDTVIWRNQDSVPHAVAADGTFDSETIQAGKTFSFKFSKAGSVSYHCVIHGSMQGSIQVK